MAAWVAARIPGAESGWDNCVAMRVYTDRTIGGVIFYDYDPRAGVLCMAAAGEPGWLNRSILYAMHAYVFDTAGCQLAVMQVSEKNERMRRIGLAYGYTEIRIPRLRGRDEAEILMTLPDEVWRASRFHKGKPDGQKIQSTRAA
jgi:RimJ/RimL family protein N-acetyltransferase